MSSLQTPNTAVKRCLRVAGDFHKHIGKSLLVDGAWDRRDRKQTFGHRGESERLGRGVVVEWRRGNRRPSGKEAPFSAVPQRKGKGPDKMMHTLFAPFLVGAEDQFAVRKDRFWISDFGFWIGIYLVEGRRLQVGEEFVAVVNAGIADQDELPLGANERLLLETIFGREAHQPLAEANGSLRPKPAAIGAKLLQRRVHALQIGSCNRLVVQIGKPKDSAHG
ncbi:hypothetical protein FJY63_02120 [Candidatus Sumerlaeota bacterium]|nr:hypothetical protein [Candidatus Sumerlaeota bacterium]